MAAVVGPGFLVGWLDVGKLEQRGLVGIRTGPVTRWWAQLMISLRVGLARRFAMHRVQVPRVRAHTHEYAHGYMTGQYGSGSREANGGTNSGSVGELGKSNRDTLPEGEGVSVGVNEKGHRVPAL